MGFLTEGVGWLAIVIAAIIGAILGCIIVMFDLEIILIEWLYTHGFYH